MNPLTLMPKIKFNHKMVWFDREIILSKNPRVRQQFWQQFNETPIKKAGLQVMNIARRSIRRSTSGKPSRVGSPPRAQESKRAKPAKVPPFKMIFSVPNLLSTSAMVGMTGFDSYDPPPPAIHEHGLTVTRTVNVNWVPRVGRRRRAGPRVVPQFENRPIKYPKRPFMQPALQTARDKLPNLWRGVISR